MRFTRKDARALDTLEARYPGLARVVCATRTGATISVDGEHIEFAEVEGVFTRGDTIIQSKELLELAFLRSKEAILAVREGHRRAILRRQMLRAEQNRREPQLGWEQLHLVI